MQMTDARLSGSRHIARSNTRGDDRGDDKYQQAFEIHESLSSYVTYEWVNDTRRVREDISTPK
ncbi:Uncharacterised protein [Burkholderia pseudomallei]|nr:Uncharacterised protein [Burkholderia pseudomallei]CAJ9213733.1 Uncharacterised protein [Burkholderia pseudomallei]